MTTRRSFLAATSAAGLALGITACSSGGSDEPVDVSDESASKGSMADYGVGKTFTASEPFDLSILFNDNPAYPYREDWLFWEEITKRFRMSPRGPGPIILG